MRKELNISKNEIWISRNLRFNYVTHVKRTSTKYIILSFNKIFSDYDEIKNAQKINENEMIKFPNNTNTFSKYGESFENSYSKIDLICKTEVPEIVWQNMFTIQKTMITSLFNIVYFNEYADEIEIGKNTSIYPNREIFKKN